MVPEEMREEIRRNSELQRAFNSGAVWDAPDEVLREYLKTLNTEGVPNEMVRHREIIRALTITHIQMARVIKALEDTMQRLNTASDRTQQLVVRLTWVAVFVGAIQAIVAIVSLCR